MKKEKNYSPSSEEILSLLPIVQHRKWKVSSEGLIRDKKGYCPLCALAEEVGMNPLKEKTLPYCTELFDTYSSEVGCIAFAADDAEIDDDTRTELLNILITK